MSELKAHSRIIVCESVITSKLDDESVVTHFETGDSFGLDRRATQIWNLVSGSITFADLTDRVSTKYAAPREVIEADLRKTLKMLIENRLVEVTEQPGE